MEFNNLEKFYKYCYNQINYKKFIELSGYKDDYYAEDLWEEFKTNPIRFIVNRKEIDFFNNIQKLIKKENYKP